MDTPAVSLLSLAFGEILFDCFEDRSLLGGAPLNFAWNLRQFGLPVGMVSAVGHDARGADIRSFLSTADIDARYVCEDTSPTGTVSVELDRGEPQFTIHSNVAWDHITLPDVLPERLDLLYFGTVAQRSEANRVALDRLLCIPTGLRLFDVNLRQQYYTEERLLASLAAATVVKFNESEWEILRQLTTARTPFELLNRFDLTVVAFTRGAAGATLYTRDGFFDEPAQLVNIVDTVGAGDAFCAALAAGLLRGKAPDLVLRTACAAGAQAVQSPGGQCLLTQEVTGALT